MMNSNNDTIIIINKSITHRLILSTFILILSFSMKYNSSHAFVVSNNNIHSTSSIRVHDAVTLLLFYKKTALNEKDLKSGYDTTDGYERFLYSKKQKKKNKQREHLLRRKIIAVSNNENRYNNVQQVGGGSGINGKNGKYNKEEDEDGYKDMMKKTTKRPFVQHVLMAPFRLGMMVTKRIAKSVPEPGTLILVRHGESEWNANKTFTVSIFIRVHWNDLSYNYIK